jgi:23S rRNA (uracil1939-C5)-methyltransferase
MKLRKTKQVVIIPDVEIVDAGAEGMSIARIDGMVVFVPFVVPGDVVDLKIIKKKKSYAEGRAIAVKHYSDRRAELQCPHFGVCGGCKWQNMQYAEQLTMKEKQVRDNLERLGHVDTAGMQSICGSDNIFYYRNKLEYTFSNRRWRTTEEMEEEKIQREAAADAMPCAGLVEEEPHSAGDSNEDIHSGAGDATTSFAGALGFHIPTLFDKVLDIEHCALQADPSNQIRLAVRKYAVEHQLPFHDIRTHAGFLRNLIIRNSSIGEWMVLLIVTEKRDEWLFPLLDFIHVTFPQITSLQYIVNDKMNDSYADLPVVPYYGKDHMMEVMPGYHNGKPLSFKINPKSFYQTNAAQAYKLYSFVADFAQLRGDEVVYDLYTGTGTIALFLAAQCRKVVGIEYVEEAIADAKENAQCNGFANTEFIAGDMAKVLTPDFISRHGRPDVVVTDPPRAGMHELVVKQLLETAPQRIVYVSCNPATQARDLALLSARYQVCRLQPVDMFPHTQHVENVAELLLRQD